MIWLIMILAVGAGLFLEQAGPAWQLAGCARPPVVLCVVMYYALNHSPGVALAVGLAAGVVSDAVSGLPIGCSPVVFFVLALTVARYRDFVFVGRWLTRMVIGALGGAALIVGMYVMLRLRMDQLEIVPIGAVPAKMLGSAGQGMLLMPMIFAGLETLESMTGCRDSLNEDEFDVID